MCFHRFGQLEKKLHEVIDIKAKGQISKRVFQENKTCQIFQKTKISYTLIRTRMCVHQRVRSVRFSERGPVTPLNSETGPHDLTSKRKNETIYFLKRSFPKY